MIRLDYQTVAANLPRHVAAHMQASRHLSKADHTLQVFGDIGMRSHL